MRRDKVGVLDPSEIEGYARPTLRIAKLAALLTLVVAILAAPLAVGAQPAGKVWRIGMLVFGGCAGPESSFQKASRDLGYTEGQNLVIECRSAKEDYARLPQAAAELVQLKVDVIAALNHPAARAAQQATTSIPIVMVASGDEVPAERREKIEQARRAAENTAAPAKITVTDASGMTRTYGSVEEMPAEIRKIYEQVERERAK